MFERQFVRCALILALLKTGNSKATNAARVKITASSSSIVKPRCPRRPPEKAMDCGFCNLLIDFCQKIYDSRTLLTSKLFSENEKGAHLEIRPERGLQSAAM